MVVGGLFVLVAGSVAARQERDDVPRQPGATAPFRDTDTADVAAIFLQLFEQLSIPLACNDPTVKDKPLSAGISRQLIPPMS